MLFAMQKVILDTNIIVSALIQKNFPYFILHELYIDRKIQLCISDDLLAEYFEVLKRDKFNRFPNFMQTADWVLKDIQQHATMHYPQQKLEVIKDKDDNMLLELAVDCNADYLVTGNTNDFTMSVYEKTKIVSPKDYWELYR
jgi:putative PIN family toxin of toxin-antitoxin system